MKKIIYLLLVSVLIFSMTGCDLLISDKEPSIDQAEELLDDGEIDDAVDMLEDLVDDDEEDYAAWQLLVEAYIEDEAYEDAADVLEDLAEVILDNYDEDDDDIEDAMDAYKDLAKDIMDEDDDIEIEEIESMLTDDDRDEDDEDTDDEEADDEDVDDEDADDEDTDDEDTDDEDADDEDTDDEDADEDIDEADTDTAEDADTDTVISTSGTSVNGIELRDDELYYEFTDIGTLIMTLNLSKDSLDSGFDISFEESEDNMRRVFEAEFVDEEMDVEILECRKTDHTLFLVIDIEDTEEFIDMMTVKQEVVESYDGDFDAMISSEPYYDYNDQSALNGSDLEFYKQNSIIEVWGSDAYFQFPFDIIATTSYEFDYINNQVVYMSIEYDYIEMIIDGALWN